MKATECRVFLSLKSTQETNTRNEDKRSGPDNVGALTSRDDWEDAADECASS